MPFTESVLGEPCAYGRHGTSAYEYLQSLPNFSRTIMAQTNPTGTTDRRIDALLALLSDNAMIVISGTKIAREIGVTRSAVWYWIEKLRGLGVRVKGHPRSGYQIEKIP